MGIQQEAIVTFCMVMASLFADRTTILFVKRNINVLSEFAEKKALIFISREVLNGSDLIMVPRDLVCILAVSCKLANLLSSNNLLLLSQRLLSMSSNR